MSDSSLLPARGKSIQASIFLTIFSISILAVFALLTGSFADSVMRTFEIKRMIGAVLTLLYLGIIFFLILKTGRVSKWRNIFFISYAICFVISFLGTLFEQRGHMELLDSDALYGEAPMCHIVVPMLLIPMILGKGIIFPTSYASVPTMLIAVIIILLVFGRGFCSWVCFYGGEETLFSRLPGKKIWNIRKPHPVVKAFPFGMLFFIVVTSFLTLTPVYCIWFCPFKTITEFFEINSTLRIFQTFLFAMLWIVLVVVLPILSKKRIQCGLFCPMGAFFSLGNKISPFIVKIDTSKCTKCLQCISVCPTFSLSAKTIEKGRTEITCTKCGDCFDICPAGAISYGMKGSSITIHNHPFIKEGRKPGFFRRMAADLWEPGTIFMFGIFLLGSVLAFNFFNNTIVRILRLMGL